MNLDEIKQVVNFYDGILYGLGYTVKKYESYHPHTTVEIHKDLKLNHVRWTCHEIIKMIDDHRQESKELDFCPREIDHRLGFVEGILWGYGLIHVDHNKKEENDGNRDASESQLPV